MLENALARAVADYRAGRLTAAAAACADILAHAPDHVEAGHLAGLVALAQGRGDAAVEALARALAAAPGHAPLWDHFGLALEGLGHRAAAGLAWRRARLLDPAAPDPWDHLAAWHRQGGDGAGALAGWRVAAVLDPGAPGRRVNFANSLLEAGRPAEALAALGTVTDFAPAEVARGRALEGLGRADDALAAYDRALALDPGRLTAQVRRGALCQARGDLGGAVNGALAALALAPDHAPARRLFAAVAPAVRFDAPHPAVDAALAHCLAADDVDHQALVPVAAAYLGLGHDLAALAADLGDSRPARARLADPALADLLAAPVFRHLLARTVPADAALERLLTALRRTLLTADTPASAHLPPALVSALALHAHAGEYAWIETAAETARLADLRRRIGADPYHADPADVALHGAYRPLSDLVEGPCRPDAWPQVLHPLVARQILAPAREAALAAGIPDLTGVREATSRAVADQYEAHPYPRWLGTAVQDRQTAADYLARRFPGFAPPAALAQPVAVLVAGCGTGRHAVDAARRFVHRGVLAVDLSTAALAHGARMAEALGVGGLRFARADLLHLTDVGPFEVIEAGGVLHHLADPEAGWRALLALLAPGGVMRIGLYSRRARAPIAAARELLAAQGFALTPDGLRAARAVILDLPDDHPAAGTRHSPDFYSLSGVRDLLFHVQETAYAPVEVADLAECLGLRVFGVETSDPAALAAYRRRWPDDVAAADLRRWGEIEAEQPHIFARMINFWVTRA